MPTPYDHGALLDVRDEQWRLARAQRFDRCTILTLDGRDRSNSGARLRVIDPFDRPRPVTGPKLRKRSRRAMIACAVAAIAAARPALGLWTAAAASIDLLPYQLEPALAVIRGATRLLLADAVGLGKTIQAGLILSELRERGWVDHALIVCPAGVRHVWARELSQRFQIPARVLDQGAIAERVAELPPGVSPWSGHGVAIASIDFVKRPEVLSAIEREPIDLLIADEAHHLSPGTDRGAAVSRLASRSPWCVFVSATPHSGDRAAFDYLTAMGAATDPIAIFRRRRTDAGLDEARRTHLLAVRPSAAEGALLSAIDRYAKAVWAARGKENPAVRLVAMTMARRAASSPAAILRTLTRRRALLSAEAVDAVQPALPWEETDAADDLDTDDTLGVAGLADAREEQGALDGLIALARQCAASTKIARLCRLLDRAGEPAVVFTEYRDTLESLAPALSPSCRVSSIHGGLPTDARRAIVDAFNAGGADVLIATDAAGEGLNLHHRCRLVIDVELPWNPLRLEQRVGRVDRIGQQRTVHAIRLFHPGTIESEVLEHLRLRRQRAEDALDRPLNDSAVARAIFEGAAVDATPALVRCHSIDAREEARRCEAQRRFLPVDAVRSWSAPRRGAPPLTALYRRARFNEDGGCIGEQLHALRVAIGRRPTSRKEWRCLIDRIESLDGGWSDDPPAAREVLAGRIESIRQQLRRANPVRYQRSLFDRRPDAGAIERQAVVERLDQALARIVVRVNGDRTRTELVALWPERRR
ncbi:MAG TPA: helicase-related protein [Vicinamibacterales bacterium]